MHELKENKPSHLQIVTASEIFDKSNSKTSMLANLVTVLCEWKRLFLRCNKFVKLTNLKFRMSLCVSFEFLKFWMLINFNAKFNAPLLFFYNSCCISNMAMLKHQLAGSLSEKTLTIEEEIKLLDANKKERQICRELADQFRIGRPQLPKLLITKPVYV